MLFLFPIFFVRRRLTIPLSCTSYFGPEWVDWGMNIISQQKSWKIPQNTKLHWNNHKYLNLFWVHGIWITWRMKNQDSPKLEKCIHDTQKRIFDSSSSTFDNLFLGRHSLMAGLRIPIQFLEERKLPPFFESKCPFFIYIIFHFFHSHHL